MPPDSEKGTLRLTTDRCGTIAEVSQFLSDLEAAYLQLYQFQLVVPSVWPSKRRRMMFMEGFPYPFLGSFGQGVLSPEAILPENGLVISRVSIESPGFWEFVASLNPLQQIREYLNDRHKRRQDKEFREASERDRLILENELIQRQVWEKDNSIFRERIMIMRELGFSESEIRQFAWSAVGRSMTQLGRHQDSGLINKAE